MRMFEKRIRQLIMTAVVLLAVTGVSAVSVPAAEKSMGIKVSAAEQAKAGDTVSVKISLKDNPGISTFAVKLTYHDEVVEYTDTTWTDTVTADPGNIQKVTEVEENGQQALNISAIMDETYEGNGTLAVVTFQAKNAYADAPFTLDVREVTDADNNPVKVTVSMSNGTAGKIHQKKAEDVTVVPETAGTVGDNGSVNQNHGETEVSDIADQTGVVSDQVSSEGMDDTPQTGSVDFRIWFLGAGIVFLVAAGLCMKGVRKKKE